MILIGIFLIVLLLLLTDDLIIGFQHVYLKVFYDAPTLGFVLLGMLLFVFLYGWKPFVAGLKAIGKRPENADEKIADYFQKLSVWTLGVGITGMILGTFYAVILVFVSMAAEKPQPVLTPVATALLSFFYAGWLSLMLFRPIAERFRPKTETVFGKFPLVSTFFALSAFFLAVVLMLVVVPIAIREDTFVWEIIRTIAANVADPMFLWEMIKISWDTALMFAVLVSLIAFRLAAGHQRRRSDWIPVCILVGVLWTFDGYVMVLAALDDNYLPACFVGMLTTLYGLLAVPFVLWDKRGICYKAAAVILTLIICSLLARIVYYLLVSG